MTPPEAELHWSDEDFGGCWGRDRGEGILVGSFRGRGGLLLV